MESGAPKRSALQRASSSANIMKKKIAPLADLLSKDIHATVKRQTGKKTNLIIGDYQLGDKLGKGAYGTVFKGLNVKTGTFVAIKRLPRKDLADAQLESLMSEVNLLKKFNHKNIVKYYGLVTSENNLNLILEYVEGGSLSGILKSYGFFPEPLVAVYVEQVLDGLAYLHKSGVVHRDIKGDNILITKEGVVKLADFGIALNGDLIDESVDCLGSPYWMSPEVIERIPSEVPTASDIWSLGCTIIELLTGDPPYSDCISLTAMFKMVQEDHPPIPENISPELSECLLLIFKKKPQDRPTALQLLKHSWILAHTKTKVAAPKKSMSSFKIGGDKKDKSRTKNDSKKNKLLDEEKALIEEIGRKQIIAFLLGENNKPSFVNGIPISSFVLIKLLNYWDEFKTRSYSIFTFVITSFSGYITGNRSNNNVLSYCLSSLSILVHLISKKAKIENPTDIKTEILDSSKEFPFEKLGNVQDDSIPLMLFYQDLRVLLATTFGFLLGNVYEALDPILSNALAHHVQDGPKSPSKKAVKPLPNWANETTHVLQEILHDFQTNFVYLEISHRFFEQIFYKIKAHLINDLITSDSLVCTNTVAREVESSFGQLEKWIEATGPEWLQGSLEMLDPARQAMAVLALPNRLGANENKKLLASLTVEPNENGLLDMKYSLPLLAQRLHVLDWNDLDNVHFPLISKNELLANWISYSSQKIDAPDSAGMRQLLSPAIDQACTDIQNALASEFKMGTT